jgi:hypothetical protein
MGAGTGARNESGLPGALATGGAGVDRLANAASASAAATAATRSALIPQQDETSTPLRFKKNFKLS